MIIDRRSFAVLGIFFAVASPFACTSTQDASNASGADSGDGAHDAGAEIGDGAARREAGQDSALRDGAGHNAPDGAGDAANVVADANDGAFTPPDSAIDAAHDTDGGTTPADDAGSIRRSAGCGLAASGTSSYVRQTITIANTSREYFLWVPRTYDPKRAYPIVFRWHGATGNGLSGGLEIEASSGEDALIVSPSGINGFWDVSPTGVDVALFDQLLARLESTYCIDTGRVFSYGFSMGGGLTYLLACVRSSVVRGIAPVEATSPVTTCSGRVAVRITQSPGDTSVSIDGAMSSRSLFLAADHCNMTTVPISPSPCVRYQGCAEGFPVDWCQTSGPHDPQGAFTGPAAWRFFDELR